MTHLIASIIKEFVSCGAYGISCMFKFFWKVSGNVDKAREILVQGVESAPLSKPLLEVLCFLPSCSLLFFSFPKLKEKGLLAER